jgi:hypothetical protein
LRATLLAPLIGQRLTGLVTKERDRDLKILADHITAGTVTPTFDRTYPWTGYPKRCGTFKPATSWERSRSPSQAPLMAIDAAIHRPRIAVGTRWFRRCDRTRRRPRLRHTNQLARPQLHPRSPPVCCGGRCPASRWESRFRSPVNHHGPDARRPMAG